MLKLSDKKATKLLVFEIWMFLGYFLYHFGVEIQNMYYFRTKFNLIIYKLKLYGNSSF